MAIQREYNTTYEYLENIFSRLDYAPQTAYESFKNLIPLQLPIDKGKISSIIRFIEDNGFTVSLEGDIEMYLTSRFIIKDRDAEIFCENYNNPASMKIYITFSGTEPYPIESNECYLKMFIELMATILSYNYNRILVKRRFHYE